LSLSFSREWKSTAENATRSNNWISKTILFTC